MVAINQNASAALPRVLVVGGGPGGVNVVQALHGVADVTLIDRKDYFEIPWANVRTHVEPELADRLYIPYSEIPKLGRVVVASATGVSDTAVTLDSGETLPYEYCVLATGSGYSSGFGKQGEVTVGQRRASCFEHAEKLKKAGSVLVIGGGPVGVEVAAEIVTDLPGKQVALVTAADRLLADKRPALGAAALSFLQRNGVKVVLGQKAKEGPDETWRTTSGEALRGEVVYVCTGGGPNSAFLAASLPDVLDEHGYVKVDKHFRVEGHPKLFALGDVCNAEGQKLGYLASLQAHLVAENIQAIGRDGAKAKLKAWTPNNGMEVMLVSLGRKAGTGHIGWVTMPSFLVATIKSGTLFVPKTRKEIGLAA